MKTTRALSWTCCTFLACAGLLATAPASVQAADAPPKDPGPVELIDNLSRQVIGLLGNKQLPLQERRKRIQDIAYANIDFPTLSRLTLGKYWRTLNASQQNDFMKEYRTHLANTYHSMIDNYNDEQVKMAGDRTGNELRDDHEVLTKVIDPKNGDESKVNYRVRKFSEGWRIIDINVEGVSLAANFRAQFEEIMNNGGYDRLIKILREKNAAAEREQGPTNEATRQPAAPAAAPH
jgi:phospholipid transport system substrate-binding protein